MTQPIDLYDAFYWVARCESFNMARGVLNCSRPTVMRAINKLEVLTGVTLFTRSSDGVQLTDAGEKLFHTVKNTRGRLIATLNEIKKSSELQRHEPGRKRMSLALDRIDYVQMANDVYDNYSLRCGAGQKAELQLLISDTRGALEAVLDGGCDFALITLPSDAKLSALVKPPLLAIPVRTGHGSDSHPPKAQTRHIFAVYNDSLPH